METELRKILTEIYRGQKENNDEAVERILLLFSVRVNEVKLICGHQHGVENCGYKHKDVYTCKHLRNCELRGN